MSERSGFTCQEPCRVERAVIDLAGARDVVLDSAVDVLKIDTQIVVNQDVAKPSQSFPVHTRM